MTRRPRWTRARLERVLGARFGRTRRGRVNTHAVADGMGVSQRTVQRWLHAPGRCRAPIPPARLIQLQELLSPDALHVTRRRQQASYAAEAIELLASGRRGLDSWEKQGWLGEHRVAIVEDARAGLRRVVTGRADASVFDARRVGVPVAEVRVPTRFHALVVAEAVLERVEVWQVDVRRPGVPATTSWFADAPTVDLPAVAREVLDE